MISWKKCRELVIGIASQIEYYDGKEVTHSERIVAKQNVNDLLVELNTEIEMKKLRESTNSNSLI